MVFGLLLVSFPVGAFVFFGTDIGGDINHEYPLTHLDLFKNTELYQTATGVSIGDAFIVLWVFYLVVFAVSFLGPRRDFFKTISPIIASGKYDTRVNYMVGIIKWFSVLIVISTLINFIQVNGAGVDIVPPIMGNALILFFYVSLAPLIEELGFRMIMLGIPLFVLYSTKPSVTYFVRCLWQPDFLNISDLRKPLLLMVFVGVFFGFAHIATDSWSEGKFAQAAASGIILGWVYLRYGFAASLLIHWAVNYFVFSYANLVSQINAISIEDAFSHSLMSTLEIILLISGTFSIVILFAHRFYSKKESTLQV